jgi:hypothetical protein
MSLWWNALRLARAGVSITSSLKGANEAVAEAAATPVLSGAVISGPASVSTGQCTSYTVTAIDQNGLPFTLAQNEAVLLHLSSAASVTFSTNSACTSSQKGFTMRAGTSSKTFFASDSAVESFLVQPILNPGAQPIYGTAFAMNFVGVTKTPTPSPTATSTPSGLNLTYEGCWYETDGSKYQALDFQLASPATLILQGELYTGNGCLPANWNDQLNDSGTPESFGTFGYIFWFTHRANMTDVSVIWSFSDTNNNLLWSSACVDYSTAPNC